MGAAVNVGVRILEAEQNTRTAPFRIYVVELVRVSRVAAWLFIGSTVDALSFWFANGVLSFFFFFQAEDGIRDWSVTGVQTCALPISRHRRPARVASGAAMASSASETVAFIEPTFAHA